MPPQRSVRSHLPVIASPQILSGAQQTVPQARASGQQPPPAQDSSSGQQVVPQARVFGQQFPATQVWSAGQQVVGQARASGQQFPATQVLPPVHSQLSPQRELSQTHRSFWQTLSPGQGHSDRH